MAWVGRYDTVAAAPPYANTEGYRLTSWLRGVVPFGPVMDGYLSPNSEIPGAIAGSSELTASRNYHPGGAQVLMMDGSVQLITDSVDVDLYRGARMSQGGEVGDPF